MLPQVSRSLMWKIPSIPCTVWQVVRRNLRTSSYWLQDNKSGSEPAPGISEQLNPSLDPWRLQRRYVTTSVNRIDTRPQGVTFDVGYIDTGADWHYSRRRTTPTVLALHGLPSSHRDMIPLVGPLYNDLGCRVIAVNFPGYELSPPVTPEDDIFFRQTTIEAVDFLVNFLRLLQINDIQVVVAHSWGALPATVLTGISDSVKSLITVCALPGHAGLRGDFGHKVLQAYVRGLDRPYLGKLLRHTLTTINNTFAKFGTNNHDYLANVFQSIAHQNFDLLNSMATNLEVRPIPFTYVCSESDRLMPYKLSREWARCYGLQDKEFEKYDNQYKLVKQAELDMNGPYRKGIVLSKGGHYPQLKTDTALPIIVNEIKHLLKLTTGKG